MRRTALTAILGGLLSLGAGPATWQWPGGKPSAGQAEGVAVAEGGALLLAPALKEILPGSGPSTVPPWFWAVAIDLKGSVYLGGGPDAQVIRVDKKGKPEVVFEVDDLGVKALATDVGGNLFVATFPTGRIYRVNPEGKTEVWFEAEERYFWSVATDAFDRLYVATGERGVVYSVSGRGEGGAFFDSAEPHITTLASDPAGRLLAGSSGRGLVYRLDGEGRAEVILDSGLGDVSALLSGSDGTIYAAAMGEPPPVRPRRPGDRGDEMRIEVTTDGGPEDRLEDVVEDRRKVVIDLDDLIPQAAEGAAVPPASRVYRIVPGRTPLVVWTSATERAYALAFDPRGNLLIGTGPQGRIYRVEPDGSATLVATLPAVQVTALATDGEGRTYALTSNPGHAFTLDPAAAGTGSFISPVHDAGTLATWGSLRWDADTPAGTRVEIVVRTGNSPVPDETWSPWTAPASDPRGSRVTAPPARYVQWRAELSRLKTEVSPLLREVVLSYLPENRPPAVRQVTASAQPARAPRRDEKDPQPPPSGEASPKPRAFRIAWTASDPDGDPLVATVALRGVDETEWKVVGRDIRESFWESDPAALPEGRLLARVEVSDAEANGPVRGAADEARSAPFDIDRTAPVLDPASVRDDAGTLLVAVAARDGVGPLVRGEWGPSADGPWTQAVARDGIADSPSEEFLVRLAPAEVPKRLFVRVSDAAGNASTVEVNLTRPR